MNNAPYRWEHATSTCLATALMACVAAGILTGWADPVSGHLLHATALLLAACWLSAAALGLTPVHLSWLPSLLLVPAAMAGIQLIMAHTASTFETLNSIAAWIARAGAFYVASSSFRSERRQHLFVEAAVWFGAAMAMLALLQWYTDNNKIFWSISTGHTSEVAATFLNRDHYSVLMEMLLPFAIVRTITGSRPILYACCAGLMFSSVVACASRAGTAIITLETLILLAVVSRAGPRRYGRVAVLVVSLLVFVILGGWQTVWERFLLKDPFSYRREMLLSTVDMIRLNPWLGHGMGTWPLVYPQFAIFDPPGIYMNHAHNDWAEWAAEGGVALSAVLAAFCAGIAWSARRVPWAWGLSAACLHAVVDFPFQKPALALTFFAIAGIAFAASRKTKQSVCHKPGILLENSASGFLLGM